MQFHVKKTTTRIDHPSRTTWHAKAMKIAQEKGLLEKTLAQCETEGMRRDYLRAVQANPFNVPGMPAFYPPEQTTLMIADIKPARECSCGGCCTARDGFICPRCQKDNS